MAKFLSQVYTQIRGSVGGITYLTTPAGAMIARARVIPVNAPSPFRTIVKSALIEAVSRWSALTVAGQAAWNTWALAHPPGDGRQQMIAGQALQGLGDISAMPGWPALMTVNTAAPTLLVHPSFTIVNKVFVGAGATGVRFTATNTSPFKVVLIAELSTGLSAGRNYWKGPWDTAQYVAFETASGAQHFFDFAGLVVGAKYFIRVRAFSFDTIANGLGRVVSSQLIASGIAVTNP